MDSISRQLTHSIADRYRLVRPLGAGGMATVYLAQDLRHDREVAIKVMRPELAAALGTERFLREIRLLARLNHPHILGLVDSGEADGLLYYVMPYVAGGSLRMRLDREQELPLADALQVLREVASALDYAHEEGIVHRDIKPENVLFSAGHAQVADFGIARILGEGDRGTALTTVGATIGTPQYMAPEQATGDPKIDHRADLYAFGVLAYEILAGAPPFAASSAAQLVAMHLAEEPVALSRRRPSVPAGLADIIDRCLQKRPADRWRTARDLKEALERVSLADGGTTRPIPAPGTVAARLPITEKLVRHLDRESFDPRMIGDSLEYLDNQADHDVLVVLLNAIWLDGSDFETHLRTLPYRCIAPTVYGFDTHARHRFALSLRDHTTLISGLVQAKVEEVDPSRLILVGFSASADLLLRLAAAPPEDWRAPDGLLALGPNQGIETCFTSRVFALLESDDPAQLLAAARTITGTASSLDDWMLLSGYLSRIMGRFRADVSPLRRLGRDIVEPFEREGPAAFATMIREASEHVPNVRCVFEDSETCNRLLRAALLDHMERGTLGEHYREGSLLIEPVPSHFDLTQPERIAAHLAVMVENLRGTRSAGSGQRHRRSGRPG